MISIFFSVIVEHEGHEIFEKNHFRNSRFVMNEKELKHVTY